MLLVFSPPSAADLRQAARAALHAESTPTAEAAISALEARFPEALIGIDHLAFRTFGVGQGGPWHQ